MSADLFGGDSDTASVAESDLRHHRWVLKSINGDALSENSADAMIPELDFGEQGHVEGNTGCNRFNGMAVLRGEHFFIESMASTARHCAPSENELERAVLSVLHQESMISLDDKGNLTLEAGGVVLRFGLRDWVV
ncbi:MAG: META domain-containing protein [Gammaproteobacteria bacterium]